MDIDRTADLGDTKVFEGPEVDATLVKVALEREGISTAIQSEEALGSSWRCPFCGETVEPQFHECWKCGTARR